MIGRYFMLDGTPVKIIGEYGKHVSNKRYKCEVLGSDQYFDFSKNEFIANFRNPERIVELKSKEEIMIAKIS